MSSPPCAPAPNACCASGEVSSATAAATTFSSPRFAVASLTPGRRRTKIALGPSRFAYLAGAPSVRSAEGTAPIETTAPVLIDAC